MSIFDNNIVSCAATFNKFINQAHAGLQATPAWFLEIAFNHALVCVCVCVCVSAPRALMTSGVIWYNIDHVCD